MRSKLFQMSLLRMLVFSPFNWAFTLSKRRARYCSYFPLLHSKVLPTPTEEATETSNADHNGREHFSPWKPPNPKVSKTQKHQKDRVFQKWLKPQFLENAVLFRFHALRAKTYTDEGINVPGTWIHSISDSHQK